MDHLKTMLFECLIGVLFVGVFSATPLHAVSLITAPQDLSYLIEEGLANNKEIQSVAVKVESLKEEIPYAGSLDDPRIGIGVINLPTDTFDFDQEAMTQKQVFIAQKVPWFGKLGLREQRQALIAVREQEILEAKRLELARKIAVTYYELGFIVNSLDINKRLTDMVSQLLKVAETRYATGKGLQQDVLQAQVELSKLLDEKILLKKKQRPLDDKMNELLNREGYAPVVPPKEMKFLNLQLDLETLQKLSLRQNPWIQVRMTDRDISAVEIELAKKNYWPDMDFKVAYGHREKDFTGRDLPDLFTATMTVNVPLWYKIRQEKKLLATQKAYDSIDKSLQGLKQTLPHKVDALFTDILDTQENYRLFSDALLLQSEQWASSSLAAYVVGKVEFNTMINAHIRLLRLELKTKEYLLSIYQKRAELEEVLGGPMESGVVKGK